MSLPILLRTVCGCERWLYIPNKIYPPEWKVPYCRKQNFHVYCPTTDGLGDLPFAHSTRIFEKTGQRGQYGYPVYLEVLDHE